MPSLWAGYSLASFNKGKNMNEFKIKPDKVDAWKKWAGNNSLDGYSFGVVKATVKVMGALDQGKTPKEANEEMYGMGISGFMAGCVAQSIAEFHERGDEFRKFWNKEWGVSEDQANGGTVNPAILTVKDKDS
jgi:hypothetical protein